METPDLRNLLASYFLFFDNIDICVPYYSFFHCRWFTESVYSVVTSLFGQAYAPGVPNLSLQPDFLLLTVVLDASVGILTLLAISMIEQYKYICHNVNGDVLCQRECW